MPPPVPKRIEKMRALSWLLRLTVFFLVLLFALRNQHRVSLFAWGEGQWQAPMVLILLGAMVTGLLLGVAAMLPAHLRQRQTLRQLRATVALQASQRAATAVTPQPDVPLPEHPPRDGI